MTSAPFAADDARALAVAFLSRVWRGEDNDLDAIDALMSEDYQLHSAGRTIAGRAAFKAWVAEFQTRLLEAKNDILEVFSDASGERVVVRWLCSGRNNGMFGSEPDGRPVAFTGIAIWRVRDGRLVECWAERAALEAYQSLMA